ncbi:MAG: urocanate hydratase [Acidobacteria bacterium]|nr:MAG: urocanate hydratase [Acidobacteriota bacterium]
MAQLEPGIGNENGPLGKSRHVVRSPRGAGLICRGWGQEAALRMMMNSLDPEVAEQPRDLIACGATGKVLRNWESYQATVEALKALRNDETLLIEAGGPAGVFETQESAARVIITNTISEGRWPTPEKLDQLEQQGIPTPGGPDPGSWTYVGTQQTLPVAFEVFCVIGRNHFGNDLAGKLIVSGGMGAAGGALPLAAGMAGAAFLGIDVDGERIRRRIRAGYCDYCVNTLDEALRILKNAVRQKHAISVGLVGNCAEVIPELASRGVLPDILTDQTAAHDLLNGYIPSGLGAEDAHALRREDPEDYRSRSRDSLSRHFEGMLTLQKLGSIVFEFGNNLCAAAERCGVTGAVSAFPEAVETYLQHLLSAGLVPVRWVALSGEPGDMRRFEDMALELFPDEPSLSRWIRLAGKHFRFQGLPARVCWMDEETRIQMAERLNRSVADGLVKAPFVVAFEHVESNLQPAPWPQRDEAEGKRDSAGDWPIMEAPLGAASGTSWASLKCGSSYSQATMALVADGTPYAANSLQRVLRSNYALDFIRLATPRYKDGFSSSWQ